MAGKDGALEGTGLDWDEIERAIACATSIEDIASRIAAMAGIGKVTAHPDLLKSHPPQRLLDVELAPEHGGRSCTLRLFERVGGGYSIAGVDRA